MGECWFSPGEDAQAKASYERALAWHAQFHGPDHPTVARDREAIAACMRMMDTAKPSVRST